MPSKKDWPIAASSSSLFLTCQYSAIGVTPNSCAIRRIVTASRPSASAIVSARSTMASRLSSVLPSGIVLVITLDNYTPYRVSYTAYMYAV